MEKYEHIKVNHSAALAAFRSLGDCLSDDIQTTSVDLTLTLGDLLLGIIALTDEVAELRAKGIK